MSWPNSQRETLQNLQKCKAKKEPPRQMMIQERPMRNRSTLLKTDLKAFCAFMEKNGFIQDVHTQADWQAARFQNVATSAWIVVWDNARSTCFTLTGDGLEWAIKFYAQKKRK